MKADTVDVMEKKKQAIDITGLGSREEGRN